MSSIRAFTLIELLVVVLVIAILAAIAVPNFLEAQTRSKVSRVKAEFRTIGTALETFRVDHNRYPPDYQSGVGPFIERFGRLTTPIAYITSVPADPFADKGAVQQYTSTQSVNGYAVPVTSSNIVSPLPYDYAYRYRNDGSVENLATWIKITSHPDVVQWALRSAGPDLWPSYLGDLESNYDPTNGTVSDGNIFWTGPGVGEDGPGG